MIGYLHNISDEYNIISRCSFNFLCIGTEYYFYSKYKNYIVIRDYIVGR